MNELGRKFLSCKMEEEAVRSCQNQNQKNRVGGNEPAALTEQMIADIKDSLLLLANVADDKAEEFVGNYRLENVVLG